MRIRKRQVPFPLSCLSPVPFSDPHLISRSPVVVQLNDDDADADATPKSSSCTPLLPQHGSAAAPSPLDRHQPSDHHPLPPIGKQTDGWDDSSGEGGAHNRRQRNKQDPLKEEDGRGQEGGQKGNDTRKGSIFGSELPADVFPQSSPSNQDGRWCEGEKAIPLKKRRGSFENVTENNTTSNNNNNNNKKTKTRMKTKMNKKCSGQQDDNIEDDEEEEVGETKPDHVNQVGKKRGRGSALMEGSRCSRVNGRGWRCCQQTLVGYSLCEHHLGKGRLRSMTSVRSRSIAAATTTAPKKLHNTSECSLPGASSSSPEKQTKCTVTDSLGNDDGEDMDEKKPLIITKKRMKLGMVKARSISSLLGQTNTEVSVGENNK